MKKPKRHPTTLLEFLTGLVDYLDLISAGADPIEALHDHVCGPDCWHWPAMSEKRRAECLRARGVQARQARR